MPPAKPKVPVNIDGDTGPREPGEADGTTAALKAQDLALDQGELVLVGSTGQTEYWSGQYASGSAFHSVRTVPCDVAHAFSSTGAAFASGDIVAFTDSNVRPRRGWLRAIVENIDQAGADVTLGPGLFEREGVHDPDSLPMPICSTIAWG